MSNLKLRRSALRARRWPLVLLALCFVCGFSPQAASAAPQDAAGDKIAPQSFEVGVAAIDITPDVPIRLNGFGSRREEATAVRQPIWAKALAIGSDEEGPVLLIAVEILGIPDQLAEDLATTLSAKSAVTRERLALTATHTHSAPMLAGENETLFGQPIPAEQLRHIRDYTAVFRDKLEQVALAALADRKPAYLSYGIGSVDFAHNRRTAGGPVDHDLPLLAVRSPEGELRAAYVSYACHCVTLSDNEISGDWAGYAAEAIQRQHPGAIALCSVGCGADSNPSSGVTGSQAEVAAAQGVELATEVERLLGGYLAPVRGKLTASFARVTLPLQQLPDRAGWEELAKQANAIGHHARTQLARLDRGEALIDHISAPVQSWQFGDSLALLFLPGETVVDYSLRLKRELDASRLWINGYANAAPGYVPSERILKEGGYEGGGAMIYYDIPTPYAAGLEQKLVDAAHSQLDAHFGARVQPDKTGGTPPLSPQQSAARIQTDPQLKAELVLAEPLVIDPVAIDFAADGSLWVAEMHDYPQGLAGDYQPGGRVRIVRDADGDGRFDTSTVFLDRIPFPTGVTTWRGGVLICAAPDILYAEDTDGDDRADVKRVLYTGFGVENYQGRVNSLSYGLDGWVYGSCGLFGGTIRSFNGAELALGDRDFRIKPDEGLIEPATGRTQQGRVRDDWGNWFGCNNSVPLIHYPLADHDLRRNPYLSPPRSQVELSAGGRLFPIVPPLRFELSGPPGLITAACGLGIYRDDLLGPAFTGNTFTCEPVSQVLHRLQLQPQGGTFSVTRPDAETQREFLASRDKWFRPVQAKTGPDGALWIVDMSRYIIEHPRWIPPEDAAQVDLRAGETLGRIYRVRPRDAQPRTIQRLDRMNSAELVAALDSPNGTVRDLAMQRLVWSSATDEATRSALVELLNASSRAATRVQALACLENLGGAPGQPILQALHDGRPGVRRLAVRLAGNRMLQHRDLVRELATLVRDEDPQVRLELAIALRNSVEPLAASMLAELAIAHPEDEFLQLAVLSSVRPETAPQLLEATLAPQRPSHSAALVDHLLTVAIATRQTEALRQATATLTTPDQRGKLQGWQARALTSLLQAAASEENSLATLLGEGGSSRVQNALSNLRGVAGDDEASAEVRRDAIGTFGRLASESPAELTVLSLLLDPREPAELQVEATRALARIPATASLDILLAAWPAATPQVKGAIFDAATSRAEWLPRVFEQFAAGTLAAVEVDAPRAQRLLQHPAAEVRRRAAEVFVIAANKDRQGVIEQYHAAMDGDAAANKSPDLAHGTLVFQKTCAACHRLRDVGHAVGPDLAPLASKSPEYLLQAILDPNSAIDARYLNYIVALRDGRTLTGMLAEESAGGITLAMQEGKREVIPRRDIDALQSTGKSLMPEGLEKDISPQDMAALVAYLRVPTVEAEALLRSFAGNEPRTLTPDETGHVMLTAAAARIHGESLIFETPFANLGYWHSPSDHAAWIINLPADAEYNAWLVYACDPSSAGNSFLLDGGAAPLRGTVASTGAWSRYVRRKVGTLRLKAGERRLEFGPEGALTNALLDLHAIELVPTGAEPQLPLPSGQQ